MASDAFAFGGYATNYFPNSSMSGAVVGTPGTMPTGIIIFNNSTGFTSSVVGTGTDANGYPYIDVSFAGTSTGANVCGFTVGNTGTMPACQGQTWTFTNWMQLVGGSFPAGLVTWDGYNEWNSGLTNAGGGSTPAVANPVSSNATKYVLTRTNTAATCAFVGLTLKFNLFFSSSFAFTIRLSGIQCEISGTSTPFISTSGAAASAVLTDPAIAASIGTASGSSTATAQATPAYQGLATGSAGGNWIRNSALAGVAAGSPGTLPTNWGLQSLPTGLTRTLSLQTIAGVQCIVINYSGTTTNATSIQIVPEPASSKFIPVTPGSIWTASAYVQVLQDDANITGLSMDAWGYDSTGSGFLTAGGTTCYAGRLTFQRVSGVVTMSNAATAYTEPMIRVTNNIPISTTINWTIAIGNWQIEQGSTAGSYVSTTGTAVKGVNAVSASQAIGVGNATGSASVLATDTSQAISTATATGTSAAPATSASLATASSFPWARASTGSYLDTAGQMQFAPNDTRRTDHAPASPFASTGVLSERASTNLYPFGNTLGRSAWVATPGSNSSGTSTDVAGIYAAASVIKHVRDTTMADTNIGSAAFFGLTTGNFVTGSFWIYIPTNANITTVSINMEVGVTLITNNVANIGLRDQWQRVWTRALLTGGNTNIVPRMVATTGDVIYTTCWQMEYGVTPTSYIPTIGSTASRAFDISAATATAASTALSTATASGTATVGTAPNVSQGTGVATAAGTSTANGFDSATDITTGTASGTSTAPAVSASRATTTATASGATTSNVVGSGAALGAATASGSSTSFAVNVSIFQITATALGTCVVSGSGYAMGGPNTRVFNAATTGTSRAVATLGTSRTAATLGTLRLAKIPIHG